MIDEVLKFCELVKAIVVQHECLVDILFLIEEKHAQASTKELLGALFKIESSTVFVCLVKNLDKSLSYRHGRLGSILR